MKKIINSIKIFAILLTLFAAQNSNAQCAPNFTYTINGGNVTFTSTSTNVSTVTTNYFWNFNNTSTGTTGSTTYSWDFGDSSPLSTATSPGHTYAANGSYIVTLVADNNVSPACISTKTTVVVVNSYCNLNASFIATPGSNG